MSHTYKPAYGAEPEFHNLQRALNDAQPEFTLQVRHAAPAKTLTGMVVYADGVDWNPGSGEGVYVRDKANAAWRYLG